MTRLCGHPGSEAALSKLDGGDLVADNAAGDASEHRANDACGRLRQAAPSEQVGLPESG
jgi:hypothetical protein